MNPPDRRYITWLDEEDQLLMERFHSGMSEAQLAALHHRTGGSIRSRLLRLGLIKPKKKPQKMVNPP